MRNLSLEEMYALIEKYGPNGGVDENDLEYVKYLGEKTGFMGRARCMNRMARSIGEAEFSLMECGRRMFFLENYSCSVPSRKAVNTLLEYLKGHKVLEVAAGYGLWASLLRQSGLDMVVTDSYPERSDFRITDNAFTEIEDLTSKEAVEKYSNFVPFPIYIDGEQVNKISAIWREPKSSVKKKQYIDFFKFISRENDDPMTWLHLSSDVPIQFHALLFVPKTNFELLGFGRKDEGINLFVRRVMVDSHAKDILPPYLRFISGVIESDDLPLNISRETLQENPFLFKIKNTVVTKFLTHLQNLASKKEDEYKSFWKQYGRILKEGYSDYTHKDKLAELFRFDSSKCIHGEEFVSLKTYSERMIDKQESIYFLSGTSREALDNNPNVEIFRSKEIEVLYCYEPVDEFVLPGLFEYNSKKIISADQEDLSRLSDILSKDQKTEKKESQKSTKEMDNLARRIKDILGDKVENVKISERLVDSPAVLVSSNPSVSSQMEKIMHMVNQDAKTTPKVMEINTKHPLIRNLLKIYKTSAKSSILTKAVNSLFNSVLLLDGSINDTHGMAAAIQDLISETTKLYINKNKNAT